MNNVDMSKLIEMLSKMDKKDLEKGIEQANQILINNKKENSSNNLNNNIK